MEEDVILSPSSMSMKAFSTTPLMRSGNLQANLGLNSSDYNQVTISLKSNNWKWQYKTLYLSTGTNTPSCYYVFQLIQYDWLFHLHNRFDFNSSFRYLLWYNKDLD